MTTITYVPLQEDDLLNIDKTPNINIKIAIYLDNLEKISLF